MSRHLRFAPLLLLATLAHAHDTEEEKKARRPDLGGMHISGQVQLWNVFTSAATDPAGDPVEDRWDMYVRRARLGLKGKIGESVDYLVSFAYDNIGKNAFTASTGSPQDRDPDEFKVWDAFFTWSAHPTWAHVTMGYFRPQVGRESITAAVEVDSFTKALPNVFPRRHVVDSGPGRETGINVGGLYHPGKWGIHYNLGIFDADHEELAGKPGGTAWSPLLAGRVSLTLGDPEMDRYKLAYKVNYFGKRNGTTLSFNRTYQGETDGFDRNTMTGVDLLANYGPWNVSGEYDWLDREIGALSYTDRVYFARCGRNFTLSNGHVLEPVVMHTKFRGDEESVDQPDGFHEIKQIGLNWYRNGNRFKLNLAYSWQDDDRGRGDFASFGIQMLY